MTPPKAPSFSAVIFDMDGLMLDTEPLARRAWDFALARYGRAIPWHVYMEAVGKSRPAVLSLFLGALGGDMPMDAVSELQKARMRQLFREQGVPVKPGLSGLLAALETRGMPAAVASSTERESVIERLTLAGIAQRFAVIVGGDEVDRSKPAPDLFLEACRRLALPPGRCVVLEDSDAGIRAAREAGAIPIMVPDTVPPAPGTRDLAHCILASLEEVKDFLSL